MIGHITQPLKREPKHVVSNRSRVHNEIKSLALVYIDLDTQLRRIAETDSMIRYDQLVRSRNIAARNLGAAIEKLEA